MPPPPARLQLKVHGELAVPPMSVLHTHVGEEGSGD